jgi:hypothetical protein
VTIEPVLDALHAAGVPHALIGGHALAARGYARFTIDIDLLTTAAEALQAGTWRRIEAAGATVERRTGDDDDPLRGVVHILFADGTDVDVVVARFAWQQAVVDRAELLEVWPGIAIRVPQTSDLILLKLAAGGVLDLRDAAMLLALDRDRLVAAVEARLADVRPRVDAVWQLVKSLEL